MATFKLADLRYLAPNALTAVSLLLAVAAIIESMKGNFTLASWMIVWCALLDIADGRIARWLRATSEFGMQFDSLSDLVAFGVAPAVLVYAVFTTDPRYADVYATNLPRIALVVIVAVYILATALRLVRYNLQTRDEHDAGFAGIPSTISGALLVTYLLAAWHLVLPTGVVAAVPLFMLALAGLMIGTFRLDLSLSSKSRGASVVLVGMLLVYSLGAFRLLPSLLFAVIVTLCLFGIVRGMGRGADSAVGDTPDPPGKEPDGGAVSDPSLPATSPGNAAGAGT